MHIFNLMGHNQHNFNSRRPLLDNNSNKPKVHPNISSQQPLAQVQYPAKIIHLMMIEVSIDCTDYCKLVDQQFDETKMTSARFHLDTALPELIRELGYTFTASVDQCRANLRQLGGGPDIHAATVARVHFLLTCCIDPGEIMRDK